MSGVTPSQVPGTSQPNPNVPRVQPPTRPAGRAVRFPREQWLFEPKRGLPIVRRVVKYGELLGEIRQDKVRSLAFADSHDEEVDEARQGEYPDFEGSCLVIYRDDTVAQAYVPPYDYRMLYAMETHGVTAERLANEPVQEMVQGPNFASLWTQRVTNVLPAIGLIGVFVATQLAGFLKGDLEDRTKIRAADTAREKAAAQQKAADDLTVEARSLADMGWSVEQIVAELDRLGVPYEVDYLRGLVEEARLRTEQGEPPPGEFNLEAEEQAAALRDARATTAAQEDSDMARAAEFLQLRTVRVRAAVSPAERERRVRMREAQRALKGVTLQYMEDDVVTFDDVAGVSDAKVELMEVVDFFTQPGRFAASGARVPRGVLLAGPPGTGKTLLARAVAGEAGVAFLSVNAAEFVEMFVGVGASRVRDLFTQARSMEPAIIFIDEIDAVGRTRGGSEGNDERDTTLNQMLGEMDGFSNNTARIIVMGATNRVDVLDPALVRPGRFDRIIYVGRPDVAGRIEVLKVHLRGRPYRLSDAEFGEISFETAHFSGAQLANLVNTAALLAARAGQDYITFPNLEQALEEERLGPRRRPYSDERQRRLAVHEGATALACTLLPAIEPVLLVTVVPREKWPLGQTVVAANEARELTQLHTRRYLEQQLLTVLAGRAAEELVYGRDEMSTINQRRLVLARRIVSKLLVSGAMREVPGAGARTLTVPLPRGSSVVQIVPARVRNPTLYAADQEMERLLNSAYADTLALMRRNRHALDALVAALTSEPDNTLTGVQVREIVEKHGAEVDLERRRRERSAFL